MNWQTHVPNIFGIDLNVIFIRFLHFFSVYYTYILILITKINDNRFYNTSIYTVFFAVFFFNFDHMFFCFCRHIFCNFSKAAYVSSLTSFNRKVVLFLAMQPLTCTHINSMGLSSVSNGGILHVRVN